MGMLRRHKHRSYRAPYAPQWPSLERHGAQPRGRSIFAPIAGRSASYILRQLHAFKTGTRSLPAALPVPPVAARLNPADMIAVAAYAASLKP